MCRWALTHPLTISEYEKLKKQLKPDFEEMVPWYSGYVISQCISSCTELDKENYLQVGNLFCRTSTDLFKTVFDLMISVTLFVGRFDMRMMQVHHLFASLKCLFSIVSACAFLSLIGT